MESTTGKIHYLLEHLNTTHFKDIPHVERCNLEFQVCDVFINYYLKKLIDTDILTEDLLEMIDTFHLGANKIIGENLYNIVSKMISDTREESHGGVILDKCFIGKPLYDKTLEQNNLNDSSKLYICKVRILPCELLSVDEIYGVGKIKFGNIGYQDFIRLGQICLD